MKQRTWIVIAGLAAALVAVFIVQRPEDVDDRVLRALLVGTWRARDVQAATLSPGRGAVAQEDVIINPDGTLKYLVIPRAGEGEPSSDNYSWEIARGKLQLRPLDGSGHFDVSPGIQIQVDQMRLSLKLPGQSTKVYERLNS